MSKALLNRDVSDDPNLTEEQREELVWAFARAGPQLNFDRPPWSIHPSIGKAQPWPDRPADYFIPIPIQRQEDLPAMNSLQHELNSYLARLNTHFLGRLSPEEQNSKDERVCCIAGPYIYHREVSAHSDAHRNAAFGRYLYDTTWWTDAPSDQGMPIHEYAGITPVLVSELRVRCGTVALLASSEQATENLRQWTDTRHVNKITKGKVTEHYVDLISERSKRPPEWPVRWHNTTVFIQSRRGWPRRLESTDEQAVHERWSFDGTFQCCLFYDPSFPSESPGHTSHRSNVRQILKGPEPRVVRIGDLVYHGTVRNFLRGERGLLVKGNRYAKHWVKDVMRIGGGGNIGTLNACRRMSCIWMQQVSVLSAALNKAQIGFAANINESNEAAFVRAQREWDLFFAEYVRLAL